MDVTVHHAGIGRSKVTIDLGGGHQVEITASHQTDRYRRVAAVWRYPGQVTALRCGRGGLTNPCNALCYGGGHAR